MSLLEPNFPAPLSNTPPPENSFSPEISYCTTPCAFTVTPPAVSSRPVDADFTHELLKSDGQCSPDFDIKVSGDNSTENFHQVNKPPSPALSGSSNITLVTPSPLENSSEPQDSNGEVIHAAICDGCEEKIVGIRHKCLDCPDWDYCSSCIENAEEQHPGHRFAPIDKPLPQPKKLDTYHLGIRCDGPLCKGESTFIRGVRYKCDVCSDTNFCSRCEASPKNTHDRSHPLMKIVTSRSPHTSLFEILNSHEGVGTIRNSGSASSKTLRELHEALNDELEVQFKDLISNLGRSTPQPTVNASPEITQLTEQAPPEIENPFGHMRSYASQEWDRRKRNGEYNTVMDELMRYEGLEEVKCQFLDILSRINVSKKQQGLLSRERFNIVFQGNPGTGKTTVARLYAKFLHSVGLLESSVIKETSGVKIAAKSVQGFENEIDKLLGTGGVLFVDEAYQLTCEYADSDGRRSLDLILTSMENNIGKLAAVFVGYEVEMESFFEHNPGLASRIPYTLNFADFSNGQLWKILYNNIHTRYKGKMRVEGGMDGLFMKIAVRRLAQSRGRIGFGNARAVENLLNQIERRQSRRLAKEYKASGGEDLDYFLFTKEDIIGPDPSEAVSQSTAWARLQELVGLEEVKTRVRDMINMIKLNYIRELDELEPFGFCMNQLFVGPPGTGKTTVARLYGQILADLGLLSKGDVVLKTPADFIGEYVGSSEAKTKRILEATAGKILVIDEAYILNPCDTYGSRENSFKAGVIDTIVSMVQGTHTEDRCIILAGYEDKMTDLFDPSHSNPGLQRRFSVEKPFVFQNFKLSELEAILQFKMREQNLGCTAQALDVAKTVFERGMMRPNFGNAGEVDNCLATAKKNYGMRQHNKLAAGLELGGTLEPEDFDINFNKSSRFMISNTRRLLQGRVHNTVIDNLISYQRQYDGARKYGVNPRSQIPTNFVFMGSPGTGKTTTAKHMGQIFFDMGFLSTTEVIECTATDLLGKCIGETVPKTRRQLERGLGKVLFIDEAYNLYWGGFATDAVGEIIQFLNQPSNAGRIVVILGGYKDDMQFLMSKQPDLSSIFTEEIIFEDMEPAECIELLVKELAHQGEIKTEPGFLGDDKSEEYKKVSRLFRSMRVMPDWANSRDVKSLADRVIGKFLQSVSEHEHEHEDAQEPHQTAVITVEFLLRCMSEVIIQRRNRFNESGRKCPDAPPETEQAQGEASSAA